MALPILRPALAIGVLLAAGACSEYGDSRGYGYSSVSVGYSSDGYRYRDRYADRYYDRYDPYYSSYYGWYDNYYYPGVGVYLYDRSGSRHRWNDGQRRYWESRRGQSEQRENWGGYRDRDGRDYRRDRHRRR